MATFHFKSKGGLILFIIVVSIVMCIPLIDSVGIVGSILMTLFAITLFTTISLALNGGSQSTASAKYKLAIEESNGIEKLRLVIRDKSLQLQSQIDKDENGITTLYTTVLQVMTAHIYLCDTFYPMVREYLDTEILKGELFEEMSQKITSDEKETLKVSSRVFGIALGIVLERTAISTNSKIQKPKVKNFINTHISNPICKKEMLETITLYFKYRNSGTTEAWAGSLEKMTYLLFDAIIKREDEDIVDPVVIEPLRAAIQYTKNSITIDDIVKKETKKAGLIS